MRKFKIAVILTICLCLAFSCFSAGVLAADSSVTLKSIRLRNIDSITLVENLCGQWQEDTDRVTYFHYEPAYDNYELQFIYSDGSYYDVSMGFLIQSGLMTVTDTQAENHWLVNNRYRLPVQFGGKTYQIPVRIIKNTVESIAFVQPQSIELTEYADGYWTTTPGDETEEWFYYNLYDSEIELEITYTNGRTDRTGLYSSYDGIPINILTDQNKEHWSPETTDVFAVEFMGHTAQIPIVFHPGTVASMTYIGPEISYVEGMDCKISIDDNGDEYFDYYIRTDDLRFDVVFSNGDEQILRYGEDYNGESISLHMNQNRKHWVVGSGNTVSATFFGYRLDIPVTITESPVKSIEILTPQSLSIVENSDGWWDTRYNSDTDQDERFFRYDIPSDQFQIRIHYRDPEKEDVVARPNQDIDGYWVNIGNDQHNNPWHVGENTLLVEFMGKTATIPVTITENPVESIEILTPDSLTLVKESRGHWNRQYDHETDQSITFYYYEFSCDDFQILVHYSDPETEDEILKLDHDYDGYPVRIGDNQNETPWQLGENTLVVEYMGKTATIPVTIIESPVESIEIVSPISLTLVENAEGWWDTRYDEETHQNVPYYYYYDVFPNDFEVVIHYSDPDLEDVVTHPHAEVNGSYVEVLDDQFETHWLPGENWLTISYLGETASIPVYIVENPVESIEVVTPQSLTFTEYQGGEWESEPVGIEETYDFYRYHIVPDDFEIVIHYTDSAREDLVVRPHDEIDGYTVRAGDNQVYQPFHVGDDNEFIIEYMGHTASIPLTLLPSSVIKGDLNGDDVVDIRDLICLKKFIASNKKMDVSGNPDLNDDNTINSLDLIALKRQILFS